MKRRNEPAYRLLTLLTLLLGASGCELQSTVTRQRSPLSLVVHAQDSQGNPVSGALVHLGPKQLESDTSGTVTLHVPFAKTEQSFSAECPTTHQGEVVQRVISPLVFESQETLQVFINCEPAIHYISVAVSSECERTSIFVDDQLLGETEHGLLHARYERSFDRREAFKSPPLRFRAHSSDPKCLLRDFVSERALAAVELSVELDEQSTAVFVSFDREPVRRRSVKRRAPPPVRPYRL